MTTETRRLRLAIIGSGERGAAEAKTAQRAATTELVAVMDVSEERARTLGDNVGVRWTTSLESILEDPGVDAVFLNSPHHVHAEQAIAAAEAGKHIIVEKPLAADLASAREMVHRAKEAGVFLGTWLGFRYRPDVVRAKELIAAGALGRVLGGLVTHQLTKPVHYFGSDARNWRSRRDQAGGGVLITQAIHFLDWLLYLVDVPVAEVSARYDTLDTDVEVEDSMVMWLRFENGALATLNASTAVPGLYRGDQVITEFRLWGTEGHLSLTPPPQFFSSRTIVGKRPERWHDLGPLPKLEDPTIEFLNRFAAPVLRGEPPEITGEDGLHVQEVIEAAYRSGELGRTVSIGELAP